MNSPDKRKNPRFNMENYPATIQSSNLKKSSVVIGNLCMDGVLIKCSKALTGVMTGQKTGFLYDVELPEVELQAVFPFKKGVMKLNVTSRVIHALKAAKESSQERAYYIGLKILHYDGNSRKVLGEILEERKLPNIQSREKK